MNKSNFQSLHGNHIQSVRANRLYTFLQNTNVLIQLVSSLWKNVVYSTKCQNKSKQISYNVLQYTPIVCIKIIKLTYDRLR